MSTDWSSKRAAVGISWKNSSFRRRLRCNQIRREEEESSSINRLRFEIGETNQSRRRFQAATNRATIEPRGKNWKKDDWQKFFSDPNQTSTIRKREMEKILRKTRKNISCLENFGQKFDRSLLTGFWLLENALPPQNQDFCSTFDEECWVQRSSSKVLIKNLTSLEIVNSSMRISSRSPSTQRCSRSSIPRRSWKIICSGGLTHF